MAQARPIPLPAPVTRAIFPVSENILEIIGLLELLMILPYCGLIKLNVSRIVLAISSYKSAHSRDRACGIRMELTRK